MLSLALYAFSCTSTFAGEKPLGPLASTASTYFVASNGSDVGPGTINRPWATINHAAENANAGDMVVVRGGHYILPAQVRPRSSGRSGAWITFIGYPGEVPILDAQSIMPKYLPGALNNGAFQIEGVSHIRVANLSVVNSHDAGFTVRDSSDIELINNMTDGTFSSGIAVWDTNHDDRGTEHIRIVGNTITRATTWDLAPPDVPRRGEPPHEALSIGGAVDFEVAYNHIYDSDKEGIDIKETSKRGRVHHNLVHDIPRQGIYVDAWFGKLSDIEIFSNVVHHCRFSGFALSVEGGEFAEKINFHDNLIFDNGGSGVYFSRWGNNNLRDNIRITRNIFYRNGYATPNIGQTYFWQTGGLYLYSTNLRDILIEKNIFSENRGFQIGYSELFLQDGRSWEFVARDKRIAIIDNLINGDNETGSPIESGGAPIDQVRIFAANGDGAIFGDPLFRNAAMYDFSLLSGSPAIQAHLVAKGYSPTVQSMSWWKRNFPPKLIHVPFDKTK